MEKKEEKKSKNKERKQPDANGLYVAHAIDDLGESTVLTLNDESLLSTEKSGDQLENVQLSETAQQQEGLRLQRQADRARGRAGGYAGYDDDEFEEHVQKKGFVLGDLAKEKGEQSSLLASAMSLEPSRADTIASDFMTAEEDAAQQVTFKKKKKKDKKKKRKRRRDDSDEEDEAQTNSLLAELEATAVAQQSTRTLPKQEESEAETVDKKTKYEKALQKGKERTQQAFAENITKPKAPILEDEEPDDAFLNAALAKARRLHRLKEMKKGADAVVEAVQSAPMEAAPMTGEKQTVTFAVNATAEFTRTLQAQTTWPKVSADVLVKHEERSQRKWRRRRSKTRMNSPKRSRKTRKARRGKERGRRLPWDGVWVAFSLICNRRVPFVRRVARNCAVVPRMNVTMKIMRRLT